MSMRRTSLRSGVCLAGVWLIAAFPGRANPPDGEHTGYGWSEQAGWLNAGAAPAPVTLVYTGQGGGFLTGYLWGENIGYVAMGSGQGPYANTAATNWGVNLDPDGTLRGFAWSDRTGWVSFEPEPRVRLGLYSGWWEGHAWSESLGWIAMKNIPGGNRVQVTWDVADQGTPAWWLYDVNPNSTNLTDVAGDDPDGDGLPTWEEFIARTLPLDGQSRFVLTALDSPGETGRLEWVGVSGLVYTVAVKTNLLGAVYESLTTVTAGVHGTMTASIPLDAPGQSFRVRVDESHNP